MSVKKGAVMRAFFCSINNEVYLLKIILENKDYFIKYGMTKIQFNNLSQDQKDQLRGLANNKITDKDYFDKFGLSKSEFDALTQDQKNVLRGVAVGPKEFFAKFSMIIF